MNPSICKLEKNETYGRYLVANRIIKQGEMILSEKPIMIGPQLDGRPLCFNCCKSIWKQMIICSKCNVAVLCGTKCTGNFHSSGECVELAKSGLTSKHVMIHNQIITPLRCLLFRNYASEIWTEMIQLEAHLEARRNTPIWKTHKLNVEDVLKPIFNLDISDEIIQRICGILDVNTFEIRQTQEQFGACLNSDIECLRGFYLKAALMAHDCIGNTHLAVDDNFVLYVYASTDIPEGHAIFFNYSNSSQGNMERLQHLKSGKYFECGCSRCTDPTELGTNISCLKCPKCRKFTMQPMDGTWECTICKKSLCLGLVKRTIIEARNKIEDAGKCDVSTLEKVYDTFLQTFHPNHYIMLQLQQIMIASYNQAIQNEDNLTRKIQLCSNLIYVYRIIEPGISRMQGMLLYELYSAKANLAQKEFDLDGISAECFLQELSTAESTLKQALEHLLYEPFNCPEGRLAQNALKELKLLRSSIVKMQEETLFIVQGRDRIQKNNKHKKLNTDC